MRKTLFTTCVLHDIITSFRRRIFVSFIFVSPLLFVCICIFVCVADILLCIMCLSSLSGCQTQWKTYTSVAWKYHFYSFPFETFGLKNQDGTDFISALGNGPCNADNHEWHFPLFNTILLQFSAWILNLRLGWGVFDTSYHLCHERLTSKYMFINFWSILPTGPLMKTLNPCQQVFQFLWTQTGVRMKTLITRC